MPLETRKRPIVLAVTAALGAVALGTVPAANADREERRGSYVAGDFHNHTTCSDGSISMQKLVKKATDKNDTPWGLDWFVQAGHGGNGNRNCTLVEDATLGTPAYPFIEGKGPQTTWANSIGAANVKGNVGNTTTPLGTQANPSMWRWQSVQEFQYPLVEYLSALKGLPLFLGLESVVAGHEHSSMSVITGQMPREIFSTPLPAAPGYKPLGNVNAFAQWTYCFDRGDTDTSRGGGQGWDCSVPGSANSSDVSWNDTAKKLLPSGSDLGIKGHNKTLEALKWMATYHPKTSYYVPAHLERAGPFNTVGSNGYNIEHLRNFNNTAPMVAFGFESQPGHGASDARGEYTARRNGFSALGQRLDSVGGTTYGGTGVYTAQVGGVWDALLGEGRNWWFFASSDWHNRGSFGADDRRSSQDFLPGEYQRNYTFVKTNDRGQLRPQRIVDGLRTGNTFAASGQLIDRLAFVACIANGREHGRAQQAVESLAIQAAMQNGVVQQEGCATMGEKLVVPPRADVIVAVVVRDPKGTNYSPYTFDNPSLLQAGIRQPINQPVLDRVDVIRGMVTGYKQPGTLEYSGQWPADWLQLKRDASGGIVVSNKTLNDVPVGAKNTSAAVIRTFGEGTWQSLRRDPEYKVMSFRLSSVSASQYVRLRGTNMPAGVKGETDADGNPLPDIYTNMTEVSAIATNVSAPEFARGEIVSKLGIPCTTVGRTVPTGTATYTGTTIDGCPEHVTSPFDGKKYVSFDVAAWSDLWFYSNPIFIEVAGSTKVAGVK